MARQRMITRTIEQTTAEVMTLNITSATVETKTYEIGGNFTNEELLKSLKKLFETETFKLVHVVSQETKELLLGMSEDDFIRYATVLPPRGTNKSEE